MNNFYVKRAFIIAFLVTCIFQVFLLHVVGILDQVVWAKEGQYVQTGDSREFSTAWAETPRSELSKEAMTQFMEGAFAYGYPAGPLIEGVIVTHSVLRVSYNTSIIIFLMLFMGLLSGCICSLCRVMSGDDLWWISILGFLSINMLYLSATPTSIMVSVLIAFLCLLTLYIYKQDKPAPIRLLILWVVIAALTVATRIDVGGISVLVFLLLLKRRISWKWVFYSILGMFILFCLFDPFMWFMPVGHIYDLIAKAVFGYAAYPAHRLSFWDIISFSSFAFLSLFLMLALAYIHDVSQKVSLVVPRVFVLALSLMTVGLYAIFLTAQYQADRYFLPVILIWEILLPPSLFLLLSHVDLHFLGMGQVKRDRIFLAKICVSVVLVLYPLVSLGQTVWIDYAARALHW